MKLKPERYFTGKELELVNASIEHDIEKVQYLCSLGVDINFIGREGMTPLIFCVLLGVHGLNFKRTTDYCAYSQTPELLNELVKFHQKTGGMVVIGVTDSTKYTLGWYAERQAGLFEDPETKQYNSGPFKQFEWLVIYSLDYGLNPGDPLHYFPETTHIALQHHMPASKVPCKLKLLKEYPYARTCLYEVEKQE